MTDPTPQDLDNHDPVTMPDIDPDDKDEKKSAATILVEIAQERYRVAATEGGDSFAVPRSGPRVVQLLRGGRHSLRSELAREFFRRIGKVPAQQALADALLVLEGDAQDAEPEELHQRVAEHHGALWLDLGDNTGRAVRVGDGRWSVEEPPPVLFRRTALTGALPEPTRGGDLADLWRWLNVDVEDRPLVLAWLVATFWPAIPHPILGLFGEQGTGKTTAMKLLVSLIDSGPVPYRKPPRDPEQWVTAAAGSWVVGLDNLSTVPDWLSDSLCRAVTGDGDVRRKLYSDGELATFAFRRAIAVTGIDLGALNGDLAERLLTVRLSVIDDTHRMEETQLWPKWAEAHPKLLGALLDVVAGVHHTLPSVRLNRRPRMADFARILAAVDQRHGTAGFDRYSGSQARMAEESLAADAFVVAIAATHAAAGFEGTAAELLASVEPDDDRRLPKGWPGTARAVTTRLTKQAPVMRKAGWKVTNDNGGNKAKVVRWTIRPPKREESGISDPPHPPNPPIAGQSPFPGDDARPARRVNGEFGGSTAGQKTRQAGQRRVKEPGREGDETAGHSFAAGQAGVAGQKSASPPLECCGDRPNGEPGGPVAPTCQLCPASPTFWRGGVDATQTDPTGTCEETRVTTDHPAARRER